MATVGTSVFTLADWAKRLDPTGKTLAITNILAQTNEILKDALFMQANGATYHRTSVLTGLPSITWRKLNRGIQPSKFTSVQVDDTMGIAEAMAKADEELIRLNGGTPGARLMEDKPYIEAMNQDVAGGLFYYDTDLDPEKFLGLSPRYPYKDAPNVIDGGGSGSDVTSIWVVGWGEDSVFAIFPKGSSAGIEQKDVGKGDPILVDDTETTVGQYLAYVTDYKWRVGLCVRDWRYVGRYCNIETSGTTNTFDHKNVIKLINKLPSTQNCKPALYANRTMREQIAIAATDSQNRQFTMMKDAFGDWVPSILGVPVRLCEAILDTETALTATP